jgi:sarcosine oxidase subunit gamma
MSDALAVAAAPRSPLDGLALPTGAAFALVLAPAMARFILRGGDDVRAAAGAAFGAEPPQALGRAGEGDGRAAIWLGPDEWLLLAERGDASAIFASLEAALAEKPHSLVDVSHRQLGLVASGAHAARAMSAGCPLDLRLRAFPVGMSTRTMFDKAEIVLWRRSETSFHVEIWRSFAPYLVAALSEAARGAPGW